MELPPLASVLLTPETADRDRLSHRPPATQQRANIAIVNPARERNPEKLETMVKCMPGFIGCLIVSSSLIVISLRRFVCLDFVLIWFHKHCTFWKRQAVHLNSSMGSKIRASGGRATSVSARGAGAEADGR